jgi:UDP-N-acetyl-2-amino-2-deoxyglucuronate dehydrogenase
MKLVLVGCGRISQRHVEAISATPGLAISQVCDINQKRAQELASRLNVPWTSSIGTIGEADVVTIATPSGLHPQHVIEAADSTSIPTIVCEKPVSLTVRELIEMYDRVDKAGKRLLPVFQNRYNPLVVLLRDLVRSGKLGVVYQCVVNVFWNRNDDYYRDSWHGTIDRDGGVLFTQASHYIDLLIFLFGSPIRVVGIGGKARRLPTQDTVSAVFEFPIPICSLNATVSTYNRNYRTEATLIAERGTIRVSGTNLNTIEYWDVEGMEKPDIDFTLDHVYGKGHDTMYSHLVNGRFGEFPSFEDVYSGIAAAEQLAYGWPNGAGLLP